MSSGFIANKVQRKDSGVDGHGNLLYPVIEDCKEKDLVLVQVKGGKNPPDINKVKAFAETIRSEGAVAGVFIIYYSRERALDTGNAEGCERGGEVQASTFGKEVSQTATLAHQAGGFAGERRDDVSRAP